MADATDVKSLLLQVDASVELLRRNLTAGDAAVAEFERKTQQRLDRTDSRFGSLGSGLLGFGKRMIGINDQAGASFKRLEGQVDASMSRVGSSVRTAATAVISLFAIDQIAEVSKRALDYASSLGEVAQQLGVTTDDLQIFRYAASQAGIETEQMDQGLAKLTKTLGEAATGAPNAIKVLRLVGFSLEEIKSGSITAGEAIPRIADFLAKIESPAQRAAVEIELFGRAGQKLDTLLAGGSEQIRQLSDAARELGLVLSKDQIEHADRTADKLSAVKQVLEANIAGVVATNADSIYNLADAFGKAAAAGGRFFNMLSNANNLSIINDQATVKLSSYFTGEDPKKVTAAAEASLMATSSGRKAYYFDLRRKSKLLRQRPLIDFDGDNAKAQADALDAKAREVAAKEFAARRAARNPTPRKGGDAGSGDLSSLNAAGGGGGGKKTRTPVDNSARDDARFADELGRLRTQRLDAEADLAGSASAEYQATLARIEEDRASFLRDIAIDKTLDEGKRKQLAAEKEKLLAVQADAAQQKLARDTAREEYDTSRANSEALIDELEYRVSIAKTLKERRDLELKLLDARKAADQASLNFAIANNDPVPADAQAKLDAKYGRRQDQVGRDTEGPYARYIRDTKDAAGRIGEDIETIAVDGLERLNDELAESAVKVLGLKGAFGEMAAAVLQDLARIIIKQLVVKSLTAVFGFSEGGVVGTPALKRAGGGPIFGPGGPREDKIPAMLSNGEFVINAAAYARHPELVEAINAGRIPRFAAGGLVSPSIPRSLSGAGAGGGAGEVPIMITLVAKKGETFDVDVASVAAPVSVQVLRQSMPQIVEASSAHTYAKLQKPNI